MTVTEFAFTLCFAVTMYRLLLAAVRPEKFLEFPTLVAGVIGFYFLPQMYVVLQDVNYEEWAVFRGLILFVLCSLAVEAGWYTARSATIARNRFFVPKKTLRVLAVLAMLGFIGWLIIRGRPADETLVGQASGLTAIGFSLLFYGALALSASLIFYFHSRHRRALMIAGFVLLYWAPYVILNGRREPLAHMALLLLSIAWFVYRRHLPRLMVPVLLVAGFSVLNLIGEYRNATLVRDSAGYALHRQFAVQELLNVEFRLLPEDPRLTDFSNAVLIADRASSEASFNYGSVLVDHGIINLFPAFLFGRDLKDSLRVTSSWHYAMVDGVGGHNGTTPTGPAQMYASFWYPGLLVFSALSYWLRRVFRRASRGSFFHQLLYVTAVIPATVGVSHGVHVVVLACIVSGIPLYIFHRYASRRSPFGHQLVTLTCPPRSRFPHHLGGGRVPVSLKLLPVTRRVVGTP